MSEIECLKNGEHAWVGDVACVPIVRCLCNVVKSDDPNSFEFFFGFGEPRNPGELLMEVFAIESKMFVEIPSTDAADKLLTSFRNALETSLKRAVGSGRILYRRLPVVERFTKKENGQTQHGLFFEAIIAAGRLDHDAEISRLKKELADSQKTVNLLPEKPTHIGQG